MDAPDLCVFVFVSVLLLLEADFVSLFQPFSRNSRCADAGRRGPARYVATDDGQKNSDTKILRIANFLAGIGQILRNLKIAVKILAGFAAT